MSPFHDGVKQRKCRHCLALTAGRTTSADQDPATHAQPPSSITISVPSRVIPFSVFIRRCCVEDGNLGYDEVRRRQRRWAASRFDYSASSAGPNPGWRASLSRGGGGARRLNSGGRIICDRSEGELVGIGRICDRLEESVGYLAVHRSAWRN